MHPSSALSRRCFHRQPHRPRFFQGQKSFSPERNRAARELRRKPGSARRRVGIFAEVCRPPSLHPTRSHQSHQSQQKKTCRSYHHHAKGRRALSQNRSARFADLFHARRNQNPQRRRRLSGLRPQNLLPITMRILETPLYSLARALVALIQSLPLPWVARLGRAGGGLAWWLDARHRRVALRNLNLCFGNEKSPDEIRQLARENFRRIGESYACAVKTAAMTFEELAPHVELIDERGIGSVAASRSHKNVVVSIGHFGNFELYARLNRFMPGYQFATTYRGLRPDSINRLLQSLRERSGCLFFDRRFDAAALKSAMNRGGIALGLLSD